jgi:threonine dehydratase
MTPFKSLTDAEQIIYRYLTPTAQFHWPLLSERTDCEVWVKHENHNPTGAFKVRGGLYYLTKLKTNQPQVTDIIAATRGNHGQSLSYAAKKLSLNCHIVVPYHNNQEKNAAMKANGATLIEHGLDFQEAFDYASELAKEKNAVMIPSFHEDLVEGVSTYALELFTHVKSLDVVYVPIGLGSGICGVIKRRDQMDLKTKIIGVVAQQARAYALSFKEKTLICTDSAVTLADGIACRCPHPEALAIINAGVEDVVEVSEDEIKAGIRHYFTDTHNLAEGAAAAALAACIKDKQRLRKQKVALILSGSNIDAQTFSDALQSTSIIAT